MGTWALGKLCTQATQGTRKAPGHSDTKGTWALGHLGTCGGTQALGHSKHFGTRALEALEHSKSAWALGHLGT